MIEAATEWLSSLTAIQRLREVGVVEPVSTLTQLAEAGQIRARASKGRFDWADEVEEFPQKPDVDSETGEMLAPWPDIPADFWRWINACSPTAEVHGEAGVFAATVEFDVISERLGSYRHEEHIRLYGVTFRADDLDAVMRGAPTFHRTPALPQSSQSNAGRKPDLNRWAEFGAALAWVAHHRGQEILRSETALYDAAANALTEAGRAPLAKRTVDLMVKHAYLWLENDKIPEPPLVG